MSPFNVCIFVLCVLCVIVESRVIKAKEYPLPPEGLTFEISIRTKSTGRPISTIKVDIDEQSKKVTVSKVHHRLKGHKVQKHKAKTQGTILENRGGFPQGNCPDMWEWNSGMCVPIADYE